MKNENDHAKLVVIPADLPAGRRGQESSYLNMFCNAMPLDSRFQGNDSSADQS